MSDDEKVIFLAFSNPVLPNDPTGNIGCATCNNKTWLAITIDTGFPILKCACCGQHAGRFGWAPEGESP